MVAVFTRNNTVHTRTLVRHGTGRDVCSSSRMMANVVTITTRFFLSFLVLVVVLVFVVSASGIGIVPYGIRISVGSVGPKNVLVRSHWYIGGGYTKDRGISSSVSVLIRLR